MRYLLLTITVFGFSKLIAQPLITGISPSSGLIGSTITINGSGFDVNPANNIVYFGSSKAFVTGASTSVVSVTAPSGINAEYLTLTKNNLTAYSPTPFIVTFPGGGPFNIGSFAPKTDIASALPMDVDACDLDGDNKPELITANNSANTISVFRNSCTSNNISFLTKTDFPTGTNPGEIVIADIDGDGMKDIIVGNRGFSSFSISVLKNTTSGGVISFAPRVDYPLTSDPYNIAIGEVDGDGKPDIVVIAGSNLIVFRNTSSLGSISFNAGLPVVSGQYPTGLAIADVNGNGKADIITCNNISSKVSVINNTSTPGNVSFDVPVSYTTGQGPIGVVVGNLDGDGKPDIAVLNYSGSSVSIFKNIGAGNSISFTQGPVLSTNIEQWDIKIADIDGDGKVDIVTGSNRNNGNKVSVFRNISLNNSIVFENKFDYSTLTYSKRLAIADLTNDGRPEVITVQSNAGITVFRNKIGDAPVITSFTPNTGGAAANVSIIGSNLGSVTAVGFGGVPVLSFTIDRDTAITAVVGQGASGNISVISPGGTATLGGFNYIPSPLISLVTPLSGPVGQRVKINGSNFSSNPADNIVYFGAVKALVNTATPIALNVTVPPGATYQPITVTVNGYTAWSSQPFNVTFTDGNLSSATFVKKVSLFNNYLDGAQNVALSDIDGDGKTDVVVNSYSTNGILIYRNTTSNDFISFAAVVTFAANGSQTVNVTIADINGDGKPDVVVPNEWNNRISVLINTSVPGTISFGTPNIFFAGSYPDHISAGDIDGDGKVDLAISTNSSTSITVLRNTSTTSSITFGVGQSFATRSFNSFSNFIGDVDGDGKPDIVVSNADDSTFSIFRNISSVGTISLDARVDYYAGHRSSFVTGADVDGDNKLDLAFGTGIYGGIGLYEDTIVVIRNLSTPGNLNFAPAIYINAPIVWNIAFSDVDGDHKPDIMYAGYDSVFVCKNISTPGNILFGTRVRFNTTLDHLYGIASGDLNNDGKPEIAGIASSGANSMFVLLNQNGSDFPLCPNGNASLISNLSGSSYQWQVDTGIGFINISNNTNYSGSYFSILQINNIPSSWYGYKYRCIVAGVSSKVFTLKFVNQWTGAVNSSWENPGNWSCGSVPDSNTDVIINSGSVTITSNNIIRSLNLAPDVIFTIGSGYMLTIIH